MVERDGIRYTLNGVELDTENTVVMLGSTYLAGIETTRTVVEVPGMHGTVPACQLPLFKDRQVTVRFGVAGAYHAQTALLARLCSMPNLTLGRTIDGIRQEAAVELVSLQADGDEVVGRYASYTAVFAMPGVWWRSPTALTMELPLTGGEITPPVGPAITNGKGWWTRALGEPDNSPSALANFVTMPLGPKDDSPSLLYTVLPEGFFGDAPVPDAILRFPASATFATFTDPVSGTGVSWQGAAGSGGYTYLDTASLAAWRSADANAWDGGTAIVGVDYPAPGPLQINPASDGGYGLKASVTGATDGVVAVHFKQSWW
jgi:hypothetical protein